MAKPQDVIRETDAAAIRQARTLVSTARYASLAVVLPDNGFPGASRVALATDFDGTPLILVSSLSWHTRALLSDPRCSLLAGEPGKGDPLAHPRVTLFARAEPVQRGSEAGRRIRRRYLARQPKAELYADFGDFSFFRLAVERASLNGGFGKAYELTAADLAAKGDAAGFSDIEKSAVAHMNDDHSDAIALYARTHARAGGGEWRIATLDSEGMDLVDGDRVCRVWYPQPVGRAADLRRVLVDMAVAARDNKPEDV